MGPMLASWTLLSGVLSVRSFVRGSNDDGDDDGDNDEGGDSDDGDDYVLWWSWQW